MRVTLQEPMNKLKGIVFDLDGTLVDSLGVTFDAFNHAICTLGGRPHTPSEIMEHFGTGEVEIFSAILQNPAQAQPAYAEYRRYIDENLARIPLHEGIGELLETLKSVGIPISIFTGRSWKPTETILGHHRLLDRFVTVVANDHVKAPKPSPEGLLLALNRMQVAPSDALFVGDMVADIKAAHAGGTRSAAVIWDQLASREELETHSPHYWAEHPRELLEVILRSF